MRPWSADDKTYQVTVTATDSAGLSDTINLTIEVVDVPELPEIITGLSVSGPRSVNHIENNMKAVATYEALGDDAAMAQWTLEGDDAGDFRLSSYSGMSTMLMFRRKPNYEMAWTPTPTTLYKVTVKASHGSGDRDGDGHPARHRLCHRRDNAPEFEERPWRSPENSAVGPSMGKTPVVGHRR